MTCLWISPFSFRISLITSLADESKAMELQTWLICNSFHTLVTCLHFKNRCAPSSSSLLQRQQAVSSFIPRHLRLTRSARLLWPSRHRKCCIFFGQFSFQRCFHNKLSSPFATAEDDPACLLSFRLDLQHTLYKLNGQKRVCSCCSAEIQCPPFHHETEYAISSCHRLPKISHKQVLHPMYSVHSKL